MPFAEADVQATRLTLHQSVELSRVMNLPRRIDRPARILAMIVVVAMAVASYRSWRELQRTLRQDEHTRRLLQDVSAALSAIRDSETGQRGYLLTGSET